MEKTVGSDNIFKDLGFDDVEADLLKKKAEAAIAIKKAMEAAGVSQSALARALEMSRPGLNRILNGNVANVSLDNLYKVARGVGAQAEFKVTPPKKRRVKAAAA